MGALYKSRYYTGQWTQADIENEYWELCAMGEITARAEATKLIEESESYTMDDFEEIFETRMAYSESFATTSYLNVSDRKFEGREEAETYYFEQGGVEKWEKAEAAKIKFSDEDCKKYDIERDSDGYVWGLFGILAC